MSWRFFTRRTVRWPIIPLSVILGACDYVQDGSSHEGVTYDRLLRAEADSGNWLTYSGAYNGQRFSRLSQINRENVHGLRRAWVYRSDVPQSVETTPLVVDGVMYLTRPLGEVLALDARTGQLEWEYHRPVPARALCCGSVNRGLAMLGHTLYVGTLDAFLVAIDARTGRQRWEVQVADQSLGFNITAAPLAVKDMIITGTSLYAADKVAKAVRSAALHPSGGMTEAELSRIWSADATDGDIAAGLALLYENREAFWNAIPEMRGRLDAYDAETGELRWRFYTVPAPGEPGNETWEGDSWRIGGSSTWMTGSFDPELNLVYWGVGNPSPIGLWDLRQGDNLYSSSVIALDADRGTLEWHYQFTPHDTHDWDSGHVPVLAEVDFGGRQRPLLLMANRNGFFYALDRSTGEFLLGRPFARQTWADGIDVNGRPILKPNVEPNLRGNLVSPPEGGATNWWSPSFSPSTGLYYVTAHDATGMYGLHPGATRVVDHDYASAVRALDPTTAEIVWEFELPPRSTSGILTTGGDVLFVGSTLGDLWALDASTGAVLWHERIDGWIHTAPITYLADGLQFVSIASSEAIFTFGLGDAISSQPPTSP